MKFKKGNKNRNFIIPLSTAVVVGLLSILFAKGSLIIWLLLLGLVFLILLVQQKTGNTALMFLVGIGAALVFIGLIAILALASKNYPIILKILSFPY